MEIRNSLIIFVTNVFSSLVNSLVFFLAVRKYSPSEFGYLSLAVSLFAFFLFFSDLNFSSTHLKKTADGKYSDDECFNTYLIMKIFLLILTSLAFIGIILNKINTGQLDKNSLQLKIIIFVFANSTISSFISLFESTLQAKLLITKKQTATIAGNLIIGLLRIIFILISNNFILFVLSSIIGHLFSLFFLIGFNEKYKFKIPEKKVFKEYFSFGLVMMVSLAINIFVMNFGPLIFENYYSEDYLGVYYVFNNIVQTFRLIQNAFVSLLIPNYVNYIKNSQFKRLKKEVIAYEKYMLILSGCFIISSFIAAKSVILILFGDFYLKIGLWFFYLSIIKTLSWGSVAPYFSLINATEQKKIILLNSFLVLLCSLLSWFLIIPQYHIIGISFGLWISYIPRGIISRLVLKKKIGIGSMEKNNFVILLIISVLSIVASLTEMLFYGNIILIAILTIVFMIGYIGLLIALKILKIDEIKKIFDQIKPKKIFLQVKNDLK